jgi:glycosyltransferase involved in cell wall biosynthesis
VSPEPARIVYLINSLGSGGAERFLCDLARNLDPERFRARVFCLYYAGQFAPLVEAADVSVEVIDVDRHVVAGNWVKTWRQLAGARADVVHTHLHEAAWYGLPTAWLRRVPVRISHLHSAHWNWPRSRRWFDRAAETFASTSFACSTSVEQFAGASLHYPSRKLRVVSNFVDVGRFAGLPGKEAARDALGLPQDVPILICLASLTEEKGQAYLLEAMRSVHAEVPDARLLLVGRDRGATDLLALAAEKGLGESVAALGIRDDVPLLLAASDISVLPSLREGLPMSLLESAAAGLPIVASAVGGIPEVVEDGVSGILTEPRDPDALAAALLALLRDPERRRQMGEAGRSRVEGRFGVGAVVGEIEDLYATMLAAAGRPVRGVE